MAKTFDDSIAPALDAIKQNPARYLAVDLSPAQLYRAGVKHFHAVRTAYLVDDSLDPVWSGEEITRLMREYFNGANPG